MNETIYYQERDDFHPQSVFTDGPVSVQTGMLRVGNDTYSLLGVISAKLRTDVQQSNYHQRVIERRRFGVYLCCIAAIAAGIYFDHYYALLVVAGALYSVYHHHLNKAKTLDEIQQRCIATLVLTRNEGETSIEIGEWGKYIDDQMASKRVRAGYSKNDVSLINERSAMERNRAEAIANAVGLAIVHGTANGSA